MLVFSTLYFHSAQAQVVRREIEYAKLPLKNSKVVAVSTVTIYTLILMLFPFCIYR